jgi:hypothetical protein
MAYSQVSLGPPPGERVTTVEFNSWFSNDDSVAAVDPADLRNIWMMQRDAQSGHADQPFTIDIRSFEQACSPEADIQALWYRISILQMLTGAMGLLSRWLRDGELADVVFQVASTFPMKRVPVGVLTKYLYVDGAPQGPPFDAQLFIEQIEKQNRQNKQ